MALSDIDRKLLERCISRKPRAWEDFVDRFMGLVVHVINHTASARSIRLSDSDREDLAAEVFMALIKEEFAVLRRFRGESSLPTYLTVVARRIVVREMLRRNSGQSVPISDHQFPDQQAPSAIDQQPTPEKRMTDREEVSRLMSQLNGAEADVVRLYHLEGRSYQEISHSLGMPENSIGPTLSRARDRMRQASPG